MQDTLTIITYNAAFIYILTSIFLFAYWRTGDRSRLILASIQLFSGLNYALYFVLLCNSEYSSQAISVNLLIMTFIGGIAYLMYSIEVISPKWLNLKRVMMLCIPIVVFISIYIISIGLGVEYTRYDSFIEMIPNITHFEVWFRLILSFSTLVPVFFIFFVPYTIQ